MGAGAPRKIGPMLKTADIVVVTKGDVVSQAEREIFAFKIRQANPSCLILHINGLSGQGSAYLSEVLLRTGDMQTLQGKELRASLPSALCSYCLGETRIGKEKQKGNVRRMELD
jgi:G3E family GTPase